MDADLQDSPEEIHYMIWLLTESTIWFRVEKETLRFCC
jgi:hypothetical protein